MKESASPPRTPNSNSHSPSDMKSHSPTTPTFVTSDESQQSTSSAQHLSAPTPTFILPQSEAHCTSGKSQLDIEFPKLTPPKTKVGWNATPNSGSRNNRKSVSSDTSSNNNSLCEDVNESHEKAAHHHHHQQQQQQQYKTGSQTISISPSSSINHQLQSPQSDRKQRQQLSCENECEKNLTDSYSPMEERSRISPSRNQCKSPIYSQHDNYNSSGASKSNACSMNIKGKPPLKNMGSSSSFEGGNTSSGFISRDSSSEQFDQNGIDLVQFFKETLNKNTKDRNMLMKIERDLLQLAVDKT